MPAHKAATFLEGCQRFIGEALHEYRVANQAELKELLKWKAMSQHWALRFVLFINFWLLRDAALNWALEYGDTLKAAGYEQGKANLCLFYHHDLDVSVMVH